MSEVLNPGNFIQLGGQVVITFGFLLFMYRINKDNRKERESSEKRYENLLKDNTEARKLDHEARNNETVAIAKLLGAVDEWNRTNGTKQEKCDKNLFRMERIAERIEECPVVSSIKEEPK